jgi:hypothetical protein
MENFDRRDGVARPLKFAGEIRFRPAMALVKIPLARWLAIEYR